jgi:hypothetical protein
VSPLQDDFVKSIGGGVTGLVGSIGAGLVKLPLYLVGGKAGNGIAGAADLGLGAYGLYKGFFESPATQDEFWLWFFRTFGIFEVIGGAASLLSAAAMGTPEFESLKAQAFSSFRQFGFDLERSLEDIKRSFEALITPPAPPPTPTPAPIYIPVPTAKPAAFA